jgi:hypothetical protein
MEKATTQGGKFAQISMFGLLSIYFIKGNSVGLRFLYGFLYAYWINHFYTLGTYAGAFLKIRGKFFIY